MIRHKNSFFVLHTEKFQIDKINSVYRTKNADVLISLNWAFQMKASEHPALKASQKI